MLVRTGEVEDQRKQYEEMVHLRRLYLGEDAANGLFASTEAQNRYMISSIEIQADPDLSTAEKAARTQANAEARINEIVASQALQQQYQDFLTAKQDILNRTADAEERHRQLEAELNVHFTPAQQESLRAMLLSQR